MERFAAPWRRKGRAAHCRTLHTPHCQSQSTHTMQRPADKRDASDSPAVVSVKVAQHEGTEPRTMPRRLHCKCNLLEL